MSVYTLADAILDTLTLRNVRDTDISSNGNVINGTLSDGTLGQLFGGQKDVRAMFTTEDVGGVAGVAGIANTGLSINPGTITIPFEKRQSFSTFSSGTDHYSASGTKGLVYPQSFQANDTGNATCQVECAFASTDGIVEPLSETAAHALGSQSFADVYALGPVTINGTAVDCPQSATINTGITIRPFFCEGNNFAKDIFIIPPLVPTITITGPSLDQFLSAMGGWTSGTALTVFFKKRATAGFVADATAEHISFSFSGGILDAGVTGSNAEDAQKSITFTGEALTVADDVAIT